MKGDGDAVGMRRVAGALLDQFGALVSVPWVVPWSATEATSVMLKVGARTSHVRVCSLG